MALTNKPKRRARVPSWFDTFDDLLAHRARFLREMQAGNITEKQFRDWCKRARARYDDQMAMVARLATRATG